MLVFQVINLRHMFPGLKQMTMTLTTIAQFYRTNYIALTFRLQPYCVTMFFALIVSIGWLSLRMLMHSQMLVFPLLTALCLAHQDNVVVVVFPAGLNLLNRCGRNLYFGISCGLTVIALGLVLLLIV